MSGNESKRDKTVPCEMAELDKAIEATLKLATALETGLVNVLVPVQSNPETDQAGCGQPSMAPSDCPLATSVREFRHRVDEVRAVLEEIFLRLDA